MLCIYNTETDPAFNIAAEEWFLRNADDNLFMLWRNSPAVIVGRNQNTAAEINSEFVEKQGVSVVRRLTGGGAVFHDLGNVNFTFLSLGEKGKTIDFHRFTEPVIEALRNMGVPADFEGRNDLVIAGRKFSGNAQLIEKDRILHHGTLLFSAQMSDLSDALKVNPEKYRDKAVKSIAKRVTNISEHLPAPLSVTEFIDRVMAHITATVPHAELRSLSAVETAAIQQLADSKYRSWDWNYGESPKYGFTRSVRTTGGTLEIHLDVDKGVIRNARIFGDFFGILPIADIEAVLVGVPHEREAVGSVLSSINIDSYVRGLTPEALTASLF